VLWEKNTSKGDVHSLPCVAYQRQFSQERVYAPHVGIQIDDVAEVQDQVPGMMNTEYSGDGSLASPIDAIRTQNRVQRINATKVSDYFYIASTIVSSDVH